MAGGKSDALENEVLDDWLGSGSPATVWIALYTATPSDAGGGTEVAGNAYARVSVTNNATNWPAAASGSKDNGVAFTFPTATPSGWGTVVAFGIHRHATNDDLLYWGPLSPSKTVNPTDAPYFDIASLIVTED